MKRIGSGWQYQVYDLGNGRVLKRYHRGLYAYWVIARDIFPFQKDKPWVVPHYVREMREKALESFKLIKRKKIPMEWIGNPVFVNDLDFEQDKVQPLFDALSAQDGAGQKKIIDEFVNFNKRLLTLGIIDQSFNITKNFGLSVTGEIVLIDIGELFDDPERIEKRRREKTWRADYVAGCISNPEVREYFTSKMDAEFGLDL